MSLALAVPSETADLPPWVPGWLHFQALDKVAHGLLFAVAAFLLARSLRRLPAFSTPHLGAFALASLYGLATEIGQHLLTDRSAEAADVGADLVGAAFGVLVALTLSRRGATREAAETRPGEPAGATPVGAAEVRTAGSVAARPAEPPARVVVSPQVVFSEVGGEAVLLHLGTQRYFTLDETGTRMWALLSEHGSVAEVRRHLLGEYEVEPEVIERDLDELVARLAEEGLVEVPETAP